MVYDFRGRLSINKKINKRFIVKLLFDVTLKFDFNPLPPTLGWYGHPGTRIMFIVSGRTARLVELYS